jgi:NADH-quinone oxidoreductase subunit M
MRKLLLGYAAAVAALGLLGAMPWAGAIGRELINPLLIAGAPLMLVASGLAAWRGSRYALFFLLFTMASIGLPGTSGFVGEFLSLGGIYQVSTWTALICTTGIILGAAYMLYLYRRVVFGEQKNPDAAAMADLDLRELLMVVPLGLAVLWMGVYPESFLAPMRADIAALDARIARAAPAGDSKPTAGKIQAGGAHEEAATHGGAH